MTTVAQQLPYERAPEGAEDAWRLTREVTFRWREPPAWVWDLFIQPFACEEGVLRRSYDSDGVRALFLTVAAGFCFAISVAPDFARALAGACLHDWLYKRAGEIERYNRVPVRDTLHAADHWFLAQMRAQGFGLARSYFIAVRIFGYGFSRLFSKTNKKGKNMRSLTLLMMLAALCAAPPGAARAGTLIEGSVTVAAGATNSSEDITLNLSASREAPEIDRLTVLNASGGGTGTVSFAAFDAGVSVAVASTNAVAPGASAAVWPRRTYTAGSTTNAERYAARTLRVNVAQSVTSSVDTVYTVGALVR